MDSLRVFRSRRPRFEELERRDTPTFATLPPFPFTAGVDAPTTIATADFNGDGFADVAIGNEFNSANNPSVGIALGKGDGTFTAVQDITNPLMNVPRSIVVADFNHDGIPDLVIGSSSSATPAIGSLLVFLGKGDGTFNGPTIVAPTPVIALGVADFNGDGSVDLVAANPDALNLPNGYQIFSGDGNGSFTPIGKSQAATINVTRVVTGDFDGDGHQDFIAVDATDNLLLPFFGDGTGRFTTPTSGFVPLGGVPTDLIAGDFNGDGKLDVVVAEDVGIRFIPNIGGRIFDATSSVAITTKPPGSKPTRLATADFDRNGLPDIVAVDFNQVQVFTSDGGGAFSPDPNSPFAIPGPTVSTDVAVGDASGDGNFDFVIVRRGNDGTVSNGRAFMNLAPIPTVTNLNANPRPGMEGTPLTFTATITFQGKPFPSGTLPTGTVRFNSDGVFLGSATLTKGVAMLVVPAFTAGNYTIVANYLGVDRFLASNSQPFDLLVTARTLQYLVTGLPTLPGFGGDRVASGSFFHAGGTDILLGSGTGRPAQIALIDGNTRQVLLQDEPFGPDFTGGVMVAAGDIDGDGISDVAVAADVGGGPRVRIYLTRGTSLVPAADFFAFDPSFRGGLRIALGDLNGDGHADLVVTGGPGAGPRVATYDGLSLLPGQTPTRLRSDFFALDPNSRLGLFVAVGDLNGDGFPEIAVSSDAGGGPRIAIFDGEALHNGTQIVVANFFSGTSDSRGGVRLAIRDVDGDGRADLVTGDGPGTGSTVRVYSGSDVYANSTPTWLAETEAMPGFFGGVYVA